MKVRIPLEYDSGAVSTVLGDEVLPLELSDRVLAPFITIDGRIHGPTSDFLRFHFLSRPNIATARRIASDLAAWLNFLTNDCGLLPFEDQSDPVLVASEEHWARFYRQCQYGTEEQVISSDGWRKRSSAIKRFYEYARTRYDHVPPFDIISFRTPEGYSGTAIAKYKPRRCYTGSAGTPLTPQFVEQLLMGAFRVDLNGHQDLYRGVDRDQAIMSLGVGAGLRRNNLANVTTYEIPPPSQLPITVMRVADRITKGDAGGEAFVFSHRLHAVHGYIAGARVEAVARSRYAPSRPLEIIEADDHHLRYRRPGSQEIVTRLWTNMGEEERRRLIEPDGTTPILFVNEYTGAPLAYDSFSNAIEGARDFVRQRINADFPQRFRLHDLRHTYAVHLTIATFRGVLSESVRPDRRDDWVVDHIADAVEFVKISLGHTSLASTRLYIQTAHRFLNIPLEQFTGGY